MPVVAGYISGCIGGCIGGYIFIDGYIVNCILLYYKNVYELEVTASACNVVGSCIVGYIDCCIGGCIGGCIRMVI